LPSRHCLISRSSRCSRCDGARKRARRPFGLANPSGSALACLRAPGLPGAGAKPVGRESLGSQPSLCFARSRHTNPARMAPSSDFVLHSPPSLCFARGRHTSPARMASEGMLAPRFVQWRALLSAAIRFARAAKALSAQHADIAWQE